MKPQVTIEELRDYLVSRRDDAIWNTQNANSRAELAVKQGKPDKANHQRALERIFTTRRNLYDELLTIIDTGRYP